MKQTFIWSSKEGDRYAYTNEIGENDDTDEILYTPLVKNRDEAYPFITDIDEYIKHAEKSEIIKNLIFVIIIHNKLSKIDQVIKAENATY